MTAVGPVVVERVYFRCPNCQAGGYASDGRLGIDGFLSRHATRLACRAGAHHSFAEAESLLEDLCGWSISDERLRQACHEEARQIAQWRATQPKATEAFPQAKGFVEFQTDATKVNTDTGWRDLKIAIFAKRPAAAAATPEQWESRDLPKPTARIAFAGIEGIDTFAPRWSAWAIRLGIVAFASITVLGDGADWIWDHSRERFPGASGVLDIYHALEHLAGTAKALFGEGTAGASDWLDRGRVALLSDGWWGICEHIGATLAADHRPETQQAFDGLRSYLATHRDRLNYRLRLHQGRSIGSGMVEGAAKNLIGKRMKQTGARWTVANANKMAELCCLNYSDQWTRYWNAV